MHSAVTLHCRPQLAFGTKWLWLCFFFVLPRARRPASVLWSRQMTREVSGPPPFHHTHDITLSCMKGDPTWSCSMHSYCAASGPCGNTPTCTLYACSNSAHMLLLCVRNLPKLAAAMAPVLWASARIAQDVGDVQCRHAPLLLLFV